MTIKEVEQLTELKKANIRYYEDEGLLTPKRNVQNNYREYGEEDVEILLKVKVLRVLGISVQDIRRLQKEEITLPMLMERRKESLKEEAQEIEILKGLCDKLENSGNSFETLDTSLVDMRESFFKMRGEKLMKLDKVYKMEKYYRLLMNSWKVLVLIYIPVRLSLQFVMHISLPSWMEIPFIAFAVMWVVATGVLRIKIAHYKVLDDSYKY